MMTDTTPPPVSPATLLRARVPRADRHVFEVVSEVSHFGLAWLIRDTSTGEQELFLSSRSRDDETLPGLLAGIEGWVGARAGGEKVALRCFAIAVRDAAAVRLDPERYEISDPLELNASWAWSMDARALLREKLATLAPTDTANRRVLYAASDGSAHPVYGHGAFAWTTSTGLWASKPVRMGILGAEVHGVIDFAAALDRKLTCRKAVLFVDSLSAIEAVQSSSVLLSLRVPFEQLQTARALIERGRLELVWVRGHKGHLLNDLADRLALLRHRSQREEGLPEQVVRELSDRMVAEAQDEIAGVDWGLSASRARAAYQQHRRMHVA